MKATAPEKIYIVNDDLNVNREWYKTKQVGFDTIEYTRTDTFIEKACEFLKSYRQEIDDGKGYIAGVVNDETIEDFKTYMEGE